MKWRIHQPDRTGVDESENVPADDLVRRTNICAGRAANATQRLTGVRIGPHRAATVVDQHEVQLTTLFGTSNERRVRRDLLAGPRAGQQPHLGSGVLESRHDFLPAGDHDEQSRQRANQVTIAFVGDQHHCSSLGDQRVCPDHARISLEKNPPKLVARQTDLRCDVVSGNRVMRLGLEQSRDLLPAFVDGWHDHVARHLVRELNDPFTEISLDHVEPSRFEVVIEKDLLGDHALALGEQLHIMRAQNAQDRVARLIRRIDLVDHSAGRLSGIDKHSPRRRRIAQDFIFGCDEPRSSGIERGRTGR